MYSYSVEYWEQSEICKKCVVIPKTFFELLVLNNVIYELRGKIISEIKNDLIRTYIVQEKICEYNVEEILSRYNTDLKKEKKNMGLTKEKEFVDEIEEESSSYSDDSLFNITSFGADMSFREIITMYDEGDLEKPEMQRNYVWDKNEASRFIDSILLGLPVPSIFLAKTGDERRLIVDGYQRIMTVYDYVKRGVFGGDGKSFALSNSENINERWRGKTFQELQPEEQRKIRSSSIHAIVFEQKEPKDDTGMYQIFERINTSGRSLKPQEIRNCVYHGKFNKLLLELNKNKNWRKIYNGSEADSRMTDIELILRMFAFAYLHDQIEVKQKQINLVKYLNTFMKNNSNLDIITEECFKEDFDVVMNFFATVFDKNLFRNGKLKEGEIRFSNKINPAIVDAIFSATLYTKKMGILETISTGDLNDRYCDLIQDTSFQNVISKRTTNTDNIKERARIAAEKLYGVSYGW